MMKTITSVRELSAKHNITAGDIWVHPDTGDIKVWQDGVWMPANLEQNTPNEDDQTSADGDKPKKRGRGAAQ